MAQTRSSALSNNGNLRDIGTLWTLTRGESSARCVLMALPVGLELRVVMDGSVLRSEHCERHDQAFDARRALARSHARSWLVALAGLTATARASGQRVSHANGTRRRSGVRVAACSGARRAKPLVAKRFRLSGMKSWDSVHPRAPAAHWRRSSSWRDSPRPLARCPRRHTSPQSRARSSSSRTCSSATCPGCRPPNRCACSGRQRNDATSTWTIDVRQRRPGLLARRRSRPAGGSSAPPDSLYRIFSVPLTRLEPGGEFDYRVSRNGEIVFAARGKSRAAIGSALPLRGHRRHRREHRSGEARGLPHAPGAAGLLRHRRGHRLLHGPDGRVSREVLPHLQRRHRQPRDWSAA